MSEVYLIAHTPNPDRLVATAAKNCYSSLDLSDLILKFYNLSESDKENMTYEEFVKSVDTNTSKFIRMLLEVGHLSPFEHPCFTFGYSGVSRSMLAQVTRHRICSFSVRSQRYVKHNHFDYYIPDSIRNSKYFKRYKRFMAIAQRFYNMMENNIPNDDRRYILPEACHTQIIHTCNARELLHIFSVRCCNLASKEIRDIADKMLYLVKDVAPVMFENAGPKCLRNGRCNEGKRSCGKFLEVKEKYNDLDNYYNELTMDGENID